MKKKFHFLVLGFLILTLLSCNNNSDEQENFSPSEPEQIIVTVLPNSATAIISWEASTDPDDQEVLYEISINDEVLQKAWKQTSLEIDLDGFNKTSKGITVVLDIEIKAYDSEGAYSTGKFSKTVTVDRSPSNFDFDEIVFNADTYSSLVVSWKAASDPDGDELFYNVYLNEIVLAENSTIPDGQSIGTVNYEEDFSALVSDPITIRVVVTDGGTEPIEISRTFDFGATDNTLGLLEAPYSETLEYQITTDEPDSRINFAFSILDTLEYSLSANGTETLVLLNSQGESVYEGNNQEGMLSPGSYKIEIKNQTTEVVNGNVVLTLMTPLENNVNLGTLNLPFDRAFTTAETLPNDTQSISFELAESADFALHILQMSNRPSDYSYTFYDGDGMEISIPPLEANYGTVYWEDLAQGRYRIEVKVYPSILTEVPEEFELKVGDFKASDQYLGVLEDPIQLNLQYESGLDPDMEARYYFTINRSTGSYLYFPGRLDVGGGYINYGLYHADGTLISPVFQESIPPGDYYIAYKGRFLSPALSRVDFSLMLRQPDYTDTDLGVLPTGESITLRGPVGEPDRKIRYTFKFDEATIGKGVQFITVKLKIELFDGAGNLLPGTYIIPEDTTETYTLVLSLENGDGPPSPSNSGTAIILFLNR
ncbi:hypothetical protein [Maribacter sp. 2308TA10-17]|uniref:hypothetical protein n=1 Tax=Maribacter sp. 2308TA10-17 TaxID=3386276 RepID=UPI0039BD084A